MRNIVSEASHLLSLSHNQAQNKDIPIQYNNYTRLVQRLVLLCASSDLY